MKNALLAILLVLFAASLISQTIPTPTQTDEIIIDNGQSGKADPADRIRYKITIQNTGGPDGTGTQLNIVPDPRTTFVPGSFRSSPLALPDGPFASIGNVGITVPDGANDLLSNDFDDNPAGLTITPVTNAATTGGGQITIAANGSFSYMPAPGFEGTDTYTYTLNDGNGVGGPVPLTDLGVVTIIVNSMIWFVDNSAGSNGDGRLGTPFNTLPNFVSGAADDPGDNIFLYRSIFVPADYTGGITLLNNQKLIGQGASSTLASATGLTVPTFSNTLPSTAGTLPIIANSGGNGITLASGNTIRGVQVGNTTGANIFGNNFGTLTVGNTTNPDVTLSSPGQALNLTNGAFNATSKFVGITSFSSSTTGISLNTVSGSLASTSTTISSPTGTGMDIQNSTASLDFGTTSVTKSTSGTAISITNSGTGSVTFGSLSVETNTVGGTGLFASMGGTINIGGMTNTISATSGPALDITSTSFGSGATFASLSSSNSPGKGINLDNVSGSLVANGGSIGTAAGIDVDINAGSGNITYAGSITNTASRSVEVTGRTGGTVTLSGNISDTGTGINVASNTGGTIAFSGSSKSLNTGANTAVTLATNTGATINFTNGGLNVDATSATAVSITGGGTVNVSGSGNTIDATSGIAFLNSGMGGNATIDINAAITSTTGRLIDIQGRTGNSVTLSGNLSNSGTGIFVNSNTGGTITFSGGTKTLNTGANTAATVTSNTGATINFTGGGLAITTTSGTGFNATGGGTVTVQGTGNTINSTSAIALNVSSTTIGASGLTFHSVSSGNNTAAADPVNGIVLNNTGASGGLTITGTGMTSGSGGTIQNTTGNSINLTSTQGVSLSNLNVSGSGAHGINGSSVNGLSLTGCQVTNSGNADNEYGMNLSNCTGTLSVNSTTFNNAADNLVYISSTSGTLTANFQNNSAFSYPMSVSGTANSAILIEPGNAAVINTTIQNCTFTNIVSQSAQFGYNLAASSGTSSFNFSNNTITVNLASRGSGITISGQENSTTNITIDNNNFSGAGGNGVISIDVNDNSRVTGTASGNTFTNPPGIGMFVAVDENANADVTLNGNTITNAGGDGIQTVNFGGAGVSDMRLYITNNNINGHSLNTSVNFVGGISFTGFEDNSCIAVRGNSVTGTPAGPTQCGGAPCVDYYIEEVGGIATFEEIPNTGNTTLNAAYLNSINDAGPVTIFGIIDLTNGVVCPVP